MKTTTANWLINDPLRKHHGGGYRTEQEWHDEFYGKGPADVGGYYPGEPRPLATAPEVPCTLEQMLEDEPF